MALMGATLAVLTVGASNAVAASFEAHGSAEQVYVTGLAKGGKAMLLRNGKKVQSGRASELGGLVFREVKPGKGYRVRSAGKQSGAMRVLSNRAAPPNKKIYDQEIEPDGYQYMKMRDGTKLALSVHPPSDLTDIIGSTLPGGVQIPTIPLGTPTPTLIEYSGYGYADPDGPQHGIAILANLMGFTVVDVNMRGTGCSGGAYDFFEPLQSLDGYDVVETIANQPWVANNQVGMYGISYGGISQLFTGALNPPHLSAIAPLSVIDNTQTTLYPGGVLNTGFAVNWAKERIHDALASGPGAGQQYAADQIADGDTVCKKNQELHGEAVNLLKKIRDNSHYVPKVADPLSPQTFVHKIHKPVYMACQWEDEQTGGHCPTLPRAMTGTNKKWFTFTNGTHVDSLDPETFNRMYDFLKIYVAEQAPATNAAVIQAGAPLIYQEAMGVPGVTLPPDPIQAQPTLAGAKAAFEQLKPVRILFDNGAGGNQPGEPKPGFEQSFSRFPVPNTKGKSWYLSGGGKLAGKRQKGNRTDRFRWDSRYRGMTDFSGDTAAGTDGLWTATPPYHWNQTKKGKGLSYVTGKLKKDTTVIGAGYAKLWVKSSKPNVDLQATISEVRPDGKEAFVQGGWLRGNERKLDRKKSRPLEPVLSLRKKDVKALPKDRYVPLTIPLYYQGHAYRKDSRIRVTIAAPNGDQPIWAFKQAEPRGHGKATVKIAHGKKRPSKLTLPVVSGVDVPTALPPCPGLRGEPCRDYVPLKN